MASAAKKIVLAFLAFFIFILLSAIPAYALRFNIDSPKITAQINPGEKYVGYITVDSYGYDEDLSINVYAEDLIYLPDGTNDFLPRGSTTWSLANWIKLEPKQFLLKANSSTMVRFSITVPPEARGGRYGVVFFEVNMPASPDSYESQSKSSVRIGSIIAVDVKGTEAYRAELTGLKTSFTDEKKLVTSCVIKNTSNVLIRPSGDFEILDKSGKVVARNNMNPDNGGILPSTSRTFEFKWEGPSLKLDKGKDYILQVTIDYGGKSLLGGQTYFNLKDE